MRAWTTTLFLALALAAPATAEPPGASEVLHELGFPAEDLQKVLAGQFVNTTLEPTSDRELAVALAFTVSVPPSELAEDARRDLLVTADPDTLAFGRIQGDGSLADFAGVTLAPDRDERARVYLDAKAGQDLNLDSAEIAAFQALGGKASPEQVEELVRKTLLARYQAYRASGLDGIAPYDRGGKKTPAAGDLRRASEAALGLKRYAPTLYQVLLGYPKATAPGLEERFEWSNYEAHGTPTFFLTHRFVMPEGDAFVVVQRQFYVSRGYNVEQAIASFLPVKEGTLVAYVNRTSTDQVTGFGGSSKRAIGSRVMASQLESLFAKTRVAADKRKGAANP